MTAPRRTMMLRAGVRDAQRGEQAPTAQCQCVRGARHTPARCSQVVYEFAKPGQG